LTKDILKDYRDLKAEQKQIELEIKEFYDNCINPSVLSHSPKGTDISDPTAMFADKAAQLHVKLLMKKYEVMTALEKIEDAIEGLEPRERRLMREYYINGLTWEQVCVKMGYEWAQIHRIHGRALKMIYKKDDTQ
jgi:DNA-directed RNA polymerase specialized sigma24 family protein